MSQAQGKTFGAYMSEAIEDHLYNELTLPSSNAVESAMSLLRSKLRAAGLPDAITTRRGHGYVLEVPEP